MTIIVFEIVELLFDLLQNGLGMKCISQMSFIDSCLVLMSIGDDGLVINRLSFELPFK